MFKKFFKDTSITFLTRIVLIVFQMVIYIVIARVFGPKGKGIYSLTMMFPAIILIFTNLGIDSAAVYFTGKKDFNINTIYGSNLFLVIPIALFSILLGIFIVFFARSFFKDIPFYLLFIGLLSIPFSLIFRNSYAILLSIKKFISYNTMQIFRFALFLILLIPWMLFLKDVSSAILSNVLSLALASLAGFLFVKHTVIKEKKLHISKKYIKKSLSFGFKNSLNNAVLFLNYRLDMFLLNFFMGPKAVGFYSIAVNISERLWLIAQSAGTVIFPTIATVQSEDKRRELTPTITRFVLYISIIAGATLFLLSKFIVILLYSDKFFNSIAPLQILLIGISISGASVTLSNDIVARGRPLINLYITLISVLIMIVLNIILIPVWGINGTAFASTVSYTLLFIGRIITYSYLSKVKLSKLILPQKEDILLLKKLFALLLRR